MRFRWRGGSTSAARHACQMRAGSQVAMASGVNHRVTSPRRTSARSYEAQLATPYFVLYAGWIRDLIPSVCSSASLRTGSSESGSLDSKPQDSCTNAQPYHERESHAHSIRSKGVNRRRGRRDRFTTASWCRSAMISRCSEARERTMNPKRVEQREDDGRHETRLSENVRNLNRGNAYPVFDSHR